MTVTGPVDALTQFRLPEFRRDPYPFLAWLRENDPVHLSSKGYYLISRHADVDLVLRNKSGLFRQPDSALIADQFPGALEYRSVTLLLNSLATMDPKPHARVRRLVAKDFTPRRVASLHSWISEAADRGLDEITEPLLAGEVVDLHSRWSKPLTLGVLSELLGIPGAEAAELAPDANELVAALGSGSEDMLRGADEHTRRLEDYFRELIALRRREPGADLVSALVCRHDEDTGQLTEDELIGMLWVLWNSGFEGIASAIEHAVGLMAGNPDQCHWLRGDHSMAVAFADEVLRHTGPQIFLGVSQIPVEDVELSGVPIPAGAQIRPVLAAANRDPEVFTDPDRFDPARDNSKSVVFGLGAHYCLGAFLAQAEIAIAMSRLHLRFPALVPAGEPTWTEGFSMRMASRVPVVLAG